MDEIAYFVNIYFTFDVTFGCFDKILRWFQSVNSLQPNRYVPVGCFFLLYYLIFNF